MLNCSWRTLDSLCRNFKQRSVFLTSHLIGQITRTQFLLRGWVFFPYMETKCKEKRRAESSRVWTENFSLNFTSFQWKWWVKYLVDSIIVLGRVCCFGFAANRPKWNLYWVTIALNLRASCDGIVLFWVLCSIISQKRSYQIMSKERI